MAVCDFSARCDVSTPANRPDPFDNRDWDAEFLAITAHLNDDIDAPSAAPVHETPSDADATNDAATNTDDTASKDADSGSGHLGEATPGALRFNPQWRMPNHAQHMASSGQAPEAADDADVDDDFVEPEPEPIDWADPYTGIMVGALVLGPLWLIYLVFFHRDASTLTWLVGVGVFVAGFVMAVLRQPHSRDEDDDDDGARV